MKQKKLLSRCTTLVFKLSLIFWSFHANELGLIQLDRDESLDPKNMVDCCSRLLENASMLRHLTHGNHILVTRYYSVNADGVICIPWNWKLAFGETSL